MWDMAFECLEGGLSLSAECWAWNCLCGNFHSVDRSAHTGSPNRRTAEFPDPRFFGVGRDWFKVPVLAWVPPKSNVERLVANCVSRAFCGNSYQSFASFVRQFQNWPSIKLPSEYGPLGAQIDIARFCWRVRYISYQEPDSRGYRLEENLLGWKALALHSRCGTLRWRLSRPWKGYKADYWRRETVCLSLNVHSLQKT